MTQKKNHCPVKRRRFLKAAGTGAALSAPGLAGCFQNPTGGGGTTTGTGNQSADLEIWLSYYTEGKTKKQYTDKIVKEFNNNHDTKVTIKGVPYTDMEKKVQAARAAGNVPQMVEVMTRPGVLAGGAGLVINDLWESSDLADKVADNVMAGHKVWGAQSTGKKGNLVSVPLGFRPYFTAWRTDWLEQAGIDKSEVNYKAGSLHWRDDIPDIYDKLKQTDLGKKDGHFPDTTGMKSSDEEYMSLYIPQHGGSLSGVVNVTGDEQTIDTPEGRKAVQMQIDYIENGYFHQNSIEHGDEESTTLHWSGKIAVNHIQDSTDLWGDYLEEQPDAMENGDYTWGMPMNAGTKAALAWLPALGFMKDGLGSQAQQEAAMEFVEWWVGDPQRAVKNAEKLGFVPVTPDAIKKEDFFAKTKMHEEFWRGACLKTLNEFDPAVIPAVPGASSITYDIPRKMHQRILSQGTSVKEATKKAGEEIQNILDKNQ